ncbi:MAG: DUF1905 domain-containing protein [Planctomycetes bacterium]|nr:DUF1905 domain-containing protein [Planctomycetota bacterium]
MKKKFSGVLGTSAPGSLFVEVPFDVKAVFGRARPPVKVTIGKHTWRSTLAVYDGKTYVGVRKSNREAAGVAVGERVTVTLEGDDGPRVVTPPSDLAAALAGDRQAATAWAKLSYTHQREHVDALADAKHIETRLRRLARTLEMLARSR